MKLIPSVDGACLRRSRRRANLAGRRPLMAPPGARPSLDLTAGAPGDRSCRRRLPLHMPAGRMRAVTVRPIEGDAA